MPSDANDARKKDKPTKSPAQLAWHSPKDAPFRVAGFAWFETDRVYRRLPMKLAEPMPEMVEELGTHTAGGQIRFQTNSRRIALRVKLAGAVGRDNMTPIAACGFDCYLGAPGKMRYASSTRFDIKQTDYEAEFDALTDKRPRHVTINFPLYQGVEEVTVGLEPHAQLLPPASYALDRRIVVYGTSITQGASASRPGMAWTNIVSRRLNVEVINEGFSGHGRGEPDVARVIAEIGRVALFVLDYEGNVPSTESLRQTLPAFIGILREKHPETPILVVSRPSLTRDLYDQQWLQARLERGAVQKKTIEDLAALGDSRLRFFDGSTLMGDDFYECTVDGVHPTDAGFMRIADALTPTLKEMIGL